MSNLQGRLLDPDGKSISAKLRVTINAYAEKNQTDWRVNPGDCIHKDCRRNYTHPRTLKEITDNKSPAELQPYTRSNYKFDFKTNCLFCGSPAKLIKVSANQRKRSRNDDVYPVTELEFQVTIDNDIKKRNYDNWAQQVFGRISHVKDLPAADAIYHQACSFNFRTVKGIPKRFSGEQLDGTSPFKKQKISPKRTPVEVMESFISEDIFYWTQHFMQN